MLNNKKILFIVHEATRTGAPVVLLSFLRWLTKNSDVSFTVLLLKDGPLKKEFEDIAKTYFIPFEYKYSVQNKVRRRLHPELSDEYKITEVVNKLSKTKYDLIYGNTIVTLPWLLQFKKAAKARVVCAVYELLYVMEYFFKKEYIMSQLQYIDLLIAGSNEVAKNLKEEFGVKDDKLKVFHAFIDVKFSIIKSPEILRQELGINENELIIGGLGTADIRKGVDMIIPLANELKRKHPEVLFKIVWVGGMASDVFIKLLKQDAKKCGVENDVIFVENTPVPNDYINLYDVFVLLSREDPFPLVLLSAAAMEKAAIAFDKSGGAPELLNEGTGFLAPYLNIEVVADIISTLYDDRNLIKETGKKARQKVEKEFSDDVIPARVLKTLEEL